MRPRLLTRPTAASASSKAPRRRDNDMHTARPLRRSVHDRVIAGVCAGIADYFGLDPTVVRVAYVLLSILSVGFPGTLIYIILWIVVPEREYY